MKKLLLASIIGLALVLSACQTTTAPVASSPADSTQETSGEEADRALVADDSLVASAGGELVLTPDELVAFSGKDGAPAYIAVDGVVYNVTDSPLWAEGGHNGYSAGYDLTEEIKEISPHGVSMLAGLPIVGVLVDD